MSRDVLALCEHGVTVGEERGASEVEAYGVLDEARRVEFTSTSTSATAAVATGLGIRVALGKRLGFYATSHLTKAEVRTAVERALAIAKVARPDPAWESFPTTYGKASVEGVFDATIPRLAVETMAEKARELIEGPPSVDRRTRVTRGAITAGVGRVAISNSYGCALERQSTAASASVTVTAEAGGRTGESSEAEQRRGWTAIDFAALYRTASARAIRMMDAKPIESGETTIVWRNKVFASIVGIMLGGTLTADAIQKQRSPWIGKRGKQIAAEHISVRDDGVRIAGLGTSAFDDEGWPQQDTPLIHHGVLVNYLYDHYTARQEGRASTGNAGRSYRSIPTPSVTNLTLNPGDATREELLGDTKRGLYIHEVIGDWLSNPISGTLNATVTNADLIEAGQLTHAVKGVMVSADFFAIIKDEATLLADDVDNAGSTYAPSVKTPKVMVIGR
jgi:PmbA protein